MSLFNRNHAVLFTSDRGLNFSQFGILIFIPRPQTQNFLGGGDNQGMKTPPPRLLTPSPREPLGAKLNTNSRGSGLPVRFQRSTCLSPRKNLNAAGRGSFKGPTPLTLSFGYHSGTRSKTNLRSDDRAMTTKRTHAYVNDFKRTFVKKWKSQLSLRIKASKATFGANVWAVPPGF